MLEVRFDQQSDGIVLDTMFGSKIRFRYRGGPELRRVKDT